ncbi:MAG: anti-sigma factor family protein [Rhodomicrobiaceae bacterium]
MTEKPSDTTLMAYADGELDASTAESVRKAIATDAELGQRLDQFHRSRALARQAYAGLMAAPPPDRLIAAIMNEPRHAASSPENSSSVRRFALPIAASLVMIAGLGGYLAGQNVTQRQGADLLGGPVLAEAVGALLTGEEREISIGGAQVRLGVLATYEVDGGICRSFEARGGPDDAMRGLSCRFGAGWHVDLAVSAPPAGGVTPAGTGPVASLDAYLDALNARGPLDREAERNTRER